MHTPGPWEREGTTVYKLNGISIKGAPKGWNLFTARVVVSDAKLCSREEAEANAALMAAAPKLLAACKSLLPILKCQPEPEVGDWNWPELAKGLEAAIAEAEPEGAK